MSTVNLSKVADASVERKREEDSPFNQLKAAINAGGHVVNGSDRAEAPLTSVGLSRLIANRNELKAFIKTAFTLPSGGRISDQYLARLMPNILAILEPHVASADGTLLVALTESERSLIHKPGPLPYIQFGGERIPFTRSDVSMLYWRLGLCEHDKFEGLALGGRLNAYIDGLRTEESVKDPRILALVGTSGSGKTRSLLELLCLRFGLFLVADKYGNGGADDFAQAVTIGRLVGTDLTTFNRQVGACVLARLLVLQHVRACGWTAAQFLSIQLFDGGLFMRIQHRLETVSFVDIHEATRKCLEQLNIQGLPIVVDEAQALLHTTPTGDSMFEMVTELIALHTHAPVAPVLIVSGILNVLKDVELLAPGQPLPTMAPSPLTPADVVRIVRQVLQSEPPAAVGELLYGRGRFVMTFLRVLLRVEIEDALCGVGPHARAEPAAGDGRALKRARTAVSGSAAGAGAGAGAARDVAAPGYAVPVTKLDPRQRDTIIWLEQLANAERVMLFGGRSTPVYLSKAVAEFSFNATSAGDNFGVMTGLVKAAVAAAMGAEKVFTPPESVASRLLQIGLASVCFIGGEPQVVVFEPLVWRAILVVVLEQHLDTFEGLLSSTMQLAYTASASALGFFYELVQPSRWAGMFHRHFVDEIPLFKTWRPRCLPEGRSLGQVYDGRMEVVGVDDVFSRTGHARPFRGSIIRWLASEACQYAVCLPPVDEGPDACLVIKLSSIDGNSVLRVLMFIQLKAMQSQLCGKELQQAKDTVIVGRMGKAKAAVKNAGAIQRGADRADALAKSVEAWTTANSGDVLGWLVCPLSNLPRSTEVSENFGTQTLFNVDARALEEATGSNAGVALVKGTMVTELTKWSSKKRS